jgi:predicted permease
MVVGDARRAIWVLQAAVGLVLLIACTNLASLVMARAESRRGEFAVRAALGATRGRLLRQTITEGVVLSALGGVLGIWLAQVATRSMLAAYPNSLPRASDIVIDVRVLLFTLAVSIATGVLFGLAPAARRHAHDLVTALKEEGGRSAAGGRHRLRRTLVTGQVALAVMLVIGAGLLIRTVLNLTAVNPGFDRSRLVTFSVTLPRATDYAGGHARAYQRLLEDLRSLPGVSRVTAMSDLPANRPLQAFGTGVEGYKNADGGPGEVIDYFQHVMSDYFDTMQIPIVAGRGFDPSDTSSGDRTIVVNEALAKKLWPGKNPIGQRIRPNLEAIIGASANPWHTVIGVARNVRQRGMRAGRSNSARMIYWCCSPTAFPKRAMSATKSSARNG